MAQIDLSALSLPQLKALLDKIRAQIVRADVASRKKLRADLAILCAAQGFTLEDVLGTQRAVTKPVSNKDDTHRFVRGQSYGNPENRTQVWNGWGPRPLWVKNFLANGGTPEQLALPKKRKKRTQPVVTDE